jgi:Holliday junction resolvase-like predicted endonuclease
MNSISVIKANGDKVNFDRTKLMFSLLKSGAPTTEVEKITTKIEASLYDGMTTKEIYKKAFALLKKHSRPSASRYKLKKGIVELGPTGYPFEKFIGELLKRQGYRVKVGVIVQGHCVQHEVDVVAQKDNKHFMVECKFHSTFTTKCNVKVPLYIQSRFIDIQKKWAKQEGHQHKFHQGWVVNNTRFSEDAIQFGRCAGLYLLSWDYPKNKSLKEQISNLGLYPITCLNTLKKSEKQQLLNRDFVLCMHLCENPKILNELRITSKRQQKILEDAHNLCKIQKI